MGPRPAGYHATANYGVYGNSIIRLIKKMAKRWNGRKMSHGKKNLARPVKKRREERKKK